MVDEFWRERPDELALGDPRTLTAHRPGRSREPLTRALSRPAGAAHRSREPRPLGAAHRADPDRMPPRRHQLTRRPEPAPPESGTTSAPHGPRPPADVLPFASRSFIAKITLR